MQKERKAILLFSLFVRMIGLEPTRLSTPDPKSGAATNYATSAAQVAFVFTVAKVVPFFILCKLLKKKFIDL